MRQSAGISAGMSDNPTMNDWARARDAAAPKAPTKRSKTPGTTAGKNPAKAGSAQQKAKEDKAANKKAADEKAKQDKA
eukprot:gene2081-13039_t